MKYFKIQESPDLKYGPRLENWYGKFDVRNIRIEQYGKLPENMLFALEPAEKVIFTDIVLFPFLLVSQTVRNVIEMYRDTCLFRNLILLDQKNKKSQLYYLPVLDETERIQLVGKTYGKNGRISYVENHPGKPITINKNIFWVRDSMKRHTIISMDFAEALLRRKVTGLGIQEVLLYDKGEKVQ